MNVNVDRQYRVEASSSFKWMSSKILPPSSEMFVEERGYRDKHMGLGLEWTDVPPFKSSVLSPLMSCTFKSWKLRRHSNSIMAT